MSPASPVPPGRRRRRRARARRHPRRNVFMLLLVVSLGGIGAAVAFGLTAQAAFTASCDLSTLRPVAIGQNSFVYAADGSLLGSIPAVRNRQPVQLSAVSPWLAKATVAIEDKRFWQHGGVDYEGIARALWRDVQAGKVVEGGSTITQQLVRNLYISRERTVERKLKEACLAIKLSKHWSKRRILAAYMNQVFFGNRAYGIEAAAQTYFSKHARNLTLGESALLAGLPQAPTDYDPFAKPERALARRDEVLRALLDNGDVTPAQYRAAAADRVLHLRPGKLYTRIREPYFFSYVRDELVARYGQARVERGGLTIYTTIDPRFQALARQAIVDTLPYRSDPAAALVAINPGNGAIRAMTAVTRNRGNQFNLAAQARRQAGSTFKVFALAAAVALGADPDATYYSSTPFRYVDPNAVDPWDVRTYDHTYVGSISLTRATLRSDNTVYAQLALDLGAWRIASMAHRLGIRTNFDVVPAIVLGTPAVSPLEMASAYATLAAGGIWSRPMAIRRVVLPSGRVDTGAGWGRPARRRVVADWVAAEVTDVLEQNMTSGTATAAYFGRPAAGKTGTTENHADAWLCGYTPDLMTAVWMGYQQGEIPMTNVHGIAVAGGTFPAQIWNRFMSDALRYSPARSFPTPATQPVWRPLEKSDHHLQYGFYGD